MADETETVTEESAPPAEPVAAFEPTPPLDPLAVATEARIRAEARAQVLEEQLVAARTAPPVAPAAVKTYTPKDVRDAFDRGEITDDQRVAYLADLQVTARLQERDAQDRTAQRESRFQTKYNAYLTRYPDLRVPGPAADAVWAAAAIIAEEEDADPRDKRIQLRAMEQVHGPLPQGDAMPTPSDVHRRRIPTGTGFGTPTAGGGPGNGGAPKVDALAGVPAGYVDVWRKMGANLSDPKTAQRYSDRFWSSRAGRQLRSPA